MPQGIHNLKFEKVFIVAAFQTETNSLALLPLSQARSLINKYYPARFHE